MLSRAAGAIFPTDPEQPTKYGAPTLVKPRLAFRVVVTDAYEQRWAVSRERTLPILDAAHIRSYADGGMHEASNGVLLRTDIHKLFDLGYVTIDEKRRFVVSSRLKADFDNGKHYYDLHGDALRDHRGPAALPCRPPCSGTAKTDFWDEPGSQMRLSRCQR